MTLMEKLFGGEGRLRRQDYWLLSIGSLVAWALFGAALIAVSWALPEGFTVVAMFLILITALVQTWISLALGIKRLHDKNMTGAWMFLVLVPVGGIVLFVLMCLDGTSGPNRFGPSPKEPIVAQPQMVV